MVPTLSTGSNRFGNLMEKEKLSKMIFSEENFVRFMVEKLLLEHLE
jgi:hypothetical protein